MKVAIIHDWLVSYGGAERVLEVLHELFPDAPVYTSVLDRSKLSPELSSLDIRTSFLQKFPNPAKYYRNYLPFLPFAFESFDLSEYDLVISSSHACAKGVKTSHRTCHICYCLTPMRYAYDMYDEYIKSENIGPLKKLAVRLIMPFIRMWDVSSSKRVSYFIAISNFIAGRIKKYYGRESTVIYPPVETGKFHKSENPQDYFLFVSRLVPQKKADVVIAAFNELKKPLKIVGTGRELGTLKRMAAGNVEFLGYQSDENVRELIMNCRALVFASKEDFGIVPVEAMAAGRPVIAFGEGGARETVIPGLTGILFDEQSKSSVIKAVNEFETKRFDAEKIREFALKFDREVFKKEIMGFVEEKYREFRSVQ